MRGGKPEDGRVSLSRRDLVFGAGAALAGTQGAWAAETTADLILDNARVWTGDLTYPDAQAVAIVGNRILAVGSTAAVARFKGPATRAIDMKRRFVMPGFNDSHVHLTGLAADYSNVDLLGARTIADVQARLAKRVSQTAPGEWVVGRAQWHEVLLAESRMLTRGDLDPISPNNPVYLPRGGHIATVNSRALQLAGITRETPNPPGGVIVRDTAGEPTGMLLESAKSLVADRLPVQAADTFRRNLLSQMKEFSGLGLTSVTNPWTTDGAVAALEFLAREKASNLRVHWTAYATSAEAVSQLRQRYAPLQGDDMLRFSGIGEPLIDGGIEGAYLRQPYNLVPGEQDDPAYRGVPMPWERDRAAAKAFYLACIQAGYNVTTHVTGDAALDSALDTLDDVAGSGDFRPLRWSLHGCFLADAAQLARVRALGLTITAQAQPYLLGRQMEKWWGKARADRSVPISAFIAAGIPVAAGSDAAAGIANPLESLGWMVNRLCLGGYRMDQRWAVPAEVALRLYTRASARTQFMEAKVGILKRGMLADLAILEESPLAVGIDQINAIKADATIIDGRVSFDRYKLFA